MRIYINCKPADTTGLHVYLYKGMLIWSEVSVYQRGLNLYLPKPMIGKACIIKGLKQTEDRYGDKQEQAIFKIVDKVNPTELEEHVKESSYIQFGKFGYRIVKHKEVTPIYKGEKLSDLCTYSHTESNLIDYPEEFINSKPKEYYKEDSSNPTWVYKYSPTETGTINPDGSVTLTWKMVESYIPKRYVEKDDSTSDHELGVPQMGGAYAEDAGIYGWDLD